MAIVFRSLTAITLLVAAFPASGDIFGLRVPSPMERDEPIEEWTVFRKENRDLREDNVHYILCRSSAEECDRDTDEKHIAEKRVVPYDTWLSELARNYQLEAKVLLNANATAKRIDATIAALNSIIGEDSNATDKERAEAKTKLASLQDKGGYRDRFQQAKSLAGSVELVTAKLILEDSDKRAYRVRWPFNFDFTVVKKTEKTVSTADILTGKEWILVLGKAKYQASRDACPKLGASLPDADDLKKAAPWLRESPLGKALDKAAGATVGVVGPAVWTRDSVQSSKVDLLDLQRYNRGFNAVPVVQTEKTKVYHYYEGNFTFFDLAKLGTQLYSPPEKSKPGISSKQTGGSISREYESYDDPSTDAVLTKAISQSPELDVLCVRNRTVDLR